MIVFKLPKAEGKKKEHLDWGQEGKTPHLYKNRDKNYFELTTRHNKKRVECNTQMLKKKITKLKFGIQWNHPSKVKEKSFLKQNLKKKSVTSKSALHKC